MERLIKKLNNSKVVFDTKLFDSWTVFIIEESGRKVALSDKECFAYFKSISIKHTKNKIYADVVKIYDKTTEKINETTIALIDSIVETYNNEDKSIVEKWLTFVYGRMTADENNYFKLFGKSIIRLGFYQMFYQDSEPEEAALFRYGRYSRLHYQIKVKWNFDTGNSLRDEYEKNAHRISWSIEDMKSDLYELVNGEFSRDVEPIHNLMLHPQIFSEIDKLIIEDEIEDEEKLKMLKILNEIKLKPNLKKKIRGRTIIFYDFKGVIRYEIPFEVCEKKINSDILDKISVITVWSVCVIDRVISYQELKDKELIGSNFRGAYYEDENEAFRISPKTLFPEYTSKPRIHSPDRVRKFIYAEYNKNFNALLVKFNFAHYTDRYREYEYTIRGIFDIKTKEITTIVDKKDLGKL